MSGKYICRVGDVEKITDLNVLYHDKAVDMKLSNDGALFEGDSLTITCDHEANPQQTVYMKRPNGKWKKTKKIVIEAGQVSDSGEYKCKTDRDLVAQVKKDIQFQNECKPIMSTQLTQASEGHLLITVKCSTVEANPTCNLDIESNDKSLKSNINENTPNYLSKQYIVDAEGLSTVPSFTCTATNVVGTSKSEVKASKDVLIDPPSKGGMSPGIVVVIILAVTFVLVGLPYAYYKFCKKPANERHIKGSQLDSVEVEKLEAGEHDENMDI